MKTAPHPKLLKYAALLSLAIFAMARSLVATVITHDIVFTENSSTDLSVTLDGSAVTASNTARDRWTVTFPATLNFGSNTAGWDENPVSSLANVVDSEGTNQLFVSSDFLFGSTKHPNGSTVTRGGTDSGTPANFNFTFHDIADSSHGVPETGSTLSLLLLPVGAFLLARWRESIRAT